MPIGTHLKHQVTLPVDAHTLFEWFSRDGAFLRLTPPWERVTLVSRDPGLEAGNRMYFLIHVGPFTIEWISEHVDYEYNESFIDMQIKGPFSYWRHLHRFRYLTENSSIMEDTIRYIPPGGALVQLLFRRHIKHKIKTFFRYRARVLFNDFTCQIKYPIKPHRILIAGGKGFIGKELTAFLTTCGHEVQLLTRQPKRANHIAWNPKEKKLDSAAVENFDAFINLAGENIAGGRWDAAKKEAILESRIQSTGLLARTINTLKNPPQTFICASAVGFYGSTDTTPADEESSIGNTFLASVCKEWENEAQKARCRVVNTRFGLVLSPKGGALRQMLLPFRLGLGGKIGSGKQMISWITMDDLLYQMYHVLFTESIQGPINFVTESPVTNQEFTKMLGQALHRPTLFTLPKSIITLILGQMGKETILSSTYVFPKKLKATGATFAYPTLKKAFEHIFPR